jgi:signal transduction histidine kinase
LQEIAPFAGIGWHFRRSFYDRDSGKKLNAHFRRGAGGSQPKMGISIKAARCYIHSSPFCRRLNNVIENLLYISAIRRGSEKYKILDGDLAALARKTAQICSEWLSIQGFKLRLNIPEEAFPAHFDPEKVSRALMNIVDNARKYSGESKTIDLRLYSEEGNAVLEVEDYGKEISQDEYSLIFEEFHRGSNVDAESGSGIGLFIVNEIIRAHGGTIELDSEVGRGSRFRLVFPACANSSKDTNAISDIRHQSANGGLL